MLGLVLGIHVRAAARKGAWMADKPGHDGSGSNTSVELL